MCFCFCRLQAQLFSERVTSKERELNNEHNFLLSKTQKEIRVLNEKLEELKRDDAQMKTKLQEAKAVRFFVFFFIFIFVNTSPNIVLYIYACNYCVFAITGNFPLGKKLSRKNKRTCRRTK